MPAGEPQEEMFQICRKREEALGQDLLVGLHRLVDFCDPGRAGGEGIVWIDQTDGWRDVYFYLNPACLAFLEISFFVHLSATDAL